MNNPRGDPIPHPSLSPLKETLTNPTASFGWHFKVPTTKQVSKVCIVYTPAFTSHCLLI